MAERKKKYGLLDEAEALGEVGLAMGSGLFGTLYGLPGSTLDTFLGRGPESQQEKYEGLDDPSGILPTVSEGVEKFGYTPESERGQQYMETIGKGGHWLDEKVRAASGRIPKLMDKPTDWVANVANASGGLNAWQVPKDYPWLANLFDQAVYTGLNVANPLKMAGTTAMIGTKAAQMGARAISPSVDLVTPMSKVVGGNRYNQLNNAMGQLITRRQRAGLQPGRMQDTNEVISGWYTKPEKTMDLRGVEHLGPDFWEGTPIKGDITAQQALYHPQALHLKEMAKTAGWRNPWAKLTKSQDAWMRRNFGITDNVYRELERLTMVRNSAVRQADEARASGKSTQGLAYRDETGSAVINETNGKPIGVTQMSSMAGEQIHAQLAYNVSMLEKFNPGDPRIARLASGEMRKYLTPRTADTTLFQVANDPSIVKRLLGEEIDDAAIRNHIAPYIGVDNALKGDKISLSTKPFFMDGPYNDFTRSAQKNVSGAGAGRGYLPELEDVLVNMSIAGEPLTKVNIIENMLKVKGMSRKQLEQFMVVDDKFISMRQSVRTDDTLLATIAVRGVYDKQALMVQRMNDPPGGRYSPSDGFYILTDQMKQGSGVPILEHILDIGSDTNKVYMDIRPLSSQKIPEKIMQSQVPLRPGRIPQGQTRSTIGGLLSEEILPQMRGMPSRYPQRYASYLKRPARYFAHQGILGEERRKRGLLEN